MRYPVSVSEAEASSHKVVPQDDEHYYYGNGNAWVQAPAFGVCSLEVLSELAAIRFDVGLVFRRFATLDLFFALGFCHKLVEFVLTL